MIDAPDINILYLWDRETGEALKMRQISTTKIQEKENFSYRLDPKRNDILLAIPCKDGTVYLVITPERSFI